MKRELKDVGATIFIVPSEYRKAHPDEKGTERAASAYVTPFWPCIARPIPMKRELKDVFDSLYGSDKLKSQGPSR